MIAYKQYTRTQFIIWRILFGAYFLFYSIALLPYARELYSREGFVQHAASNWTSKFFPALLTAHDSLPAIYLASSVLALASICFMVGWQRKIAAGLMAGILICFFNRNNLTGDPALSFLYWLLIATIAIPDEKQRGWKLPQNVYRAALIVLATGYCLGAILKLMTPSWAQGTALAIIFMLPNTRFGWVSHLAALPAPVIALLTVGVILLELLAPLFLLLPRTRQNWLIGLTGMHLLALMMYTITQVSIGMLLYHLFLLDGSWIKKKH